MPEINLLECEPFFYAEHTLTKEPTSQEMGYTKHVVLHFYDEMQISHEKEISSFQKVEKDDTYKKKEGEKKNPSWLNLGR